MNVLQASSTATGAQGKGINSPFIFVMVMEFLSIQLELVVASGTIKLNKGLPINKDESKIFFSSRCENKAE